MNSSKLVIISFLAAVWGSACDSDTKYRESPHTSKNSEQSFSLIEIKKRFAPADRWENVAEDLPAGVIMEQSLQ